MRVCKRRQLDVVIESSVARDNPRTVSLMYHPIWIEMVAGAHAVSDCPQSELPKHAPSVHASLPGDHRALEPPDPIPNSEVKRRIADGSVGFPHVRVGHRQAPKWKRAIPDGVALLLFGTGDLLPPS